MSTVAVLGSSGQTGRRIVDRLTRDGHHVLTRDGHHVLAVSRRVGVDASPRVRTAIADLTRASESDLRELLSGVGAVVFAAVAADDRAQAHCRREVLADELGERAVRRGVKVRAGGRQRLPSPGTLAVPRRGSG